MEVVKVEPIGLSGSLTDDRPTLVDRHVMKEEPEGFP
jgi:hypothetical protein